ncbi:hypothetical protein POSPLADRAFT_1140701 [Postia placenta MAD-698-R-SB12]|uniref:Fatty acid desaturase domain-containing protein n=1 Tax=Postia placenta MAD-698-R-SB12 TaxID=670580 RepID=A0A1X6N1Y4_9APHY|nr:hypothetical protein POSPLADRAFT_1140701 [Postia placenta MAD-698-R-SB12]OSX62627.1 hypothetical protein POSPLADRAFT_1140701 [Postia placenta MAD-698-R-SB12]
MQVYREDELPEYTPLPWSLGQIRAAIPSHLWERKTYRGLYYLARDIFMATAAWKGILWAESVLTRPCVVHILGSSVSKLALYCVWLIYWWFQSLIFAGIWGIGHECGHGAFSPNRQICDIVGFIVHTTLWTPYFSWKYSHRRHHMNHASMECDEVYIPKTRSDLGIPKDIRESDYEDYLGDIPIYTLCILLRQQLLAFPAYFLLNVSGRKDYPRWTNHYNPNSALFYKHQYYNIVVSDLGILVMTIIVFHAGETWGAAKVMKLYGAPWLLVTHWFIMITYLHHTDINIPHYRDGQWNFQRGAASTIDRDFLGWQGRFFLHDIAHYHVVHHFPPTIPFCELTHHCAEATKYLRAYIGSYYRRSKKPVFRALWDTYNECQFVDDEGDIVFYRDREGRASMRPVAIAAHCADANSADGWERSSKGISEHEGGRFCHVP